VEWVLLVSGGNGWRRFSVAIPGSVVSDTPHLREKTAKLGAIARACSIFGVTEIILYPDDAHRDQREDLQFCSDILTYIETPQYLRRKLFKLSPTFRFTGVLPPLQIPSHNVPSSLSKVKVGDFRDGVVVARGGSYVDVDAGLKETIKCQGNYRIDERVTLQFIEVGKDLRGEIVEESKISMSHPDIQPIYWGYRVHKAESLGKALKNRLWGLKIGTSRYGVPVQEVLPSLSKALKISPSILVAFGSPKLGLGEILKPEKLDPKSVFDYFVNTASDQQTATVRTEEAVLVSLGILNLARKLAG
jgi:predicted SPOUT superfamily RNA methylase MTH1